MLRLLDLEPYEAFVFTDPGDEEKLFVVVDKKSPLPERTVVKLLENGATYLRRSDETVRRPNF